MTNTNANDMKPKNNSDKQPQTLQEFQREKLKLMEFLCAWLDAGKSLEELEIMIDIRAAAGRMKERTREVSHEALEIIKQAREQGADHNEVLAFLRESQAREEGADHCV